MRRVVARAGFRVGDVEVVVLVDEHAARPAELRPLLDELSALIEDLDAVAAAAADEEPPLRIHGERVRLIEFAGAGSAPPAAVPHFDQELAGLVELVDPAAAGAVDRRDEDVAVRRDQHVVRLIAAFGIGRAAGVPSVSSSLPSGLNLKT